MKTQKYFLRWMAMMLFAIFSIGSWAVNPAYFCRITNAAQVSCNVWEFDVMIARSGSTTFNLAQWKLGILMNPGVIPAGGVINVAPVPNSSNGLNINSRPGPGNFNYDAVKNCIYVTPVAPTATNYTTITLTAIRLCRIRVACSLPFVVATTPNPAWNFTLATGYVTQIFALVGSTNTDITVQASHTCVAPYNPAFTGSWPAPSAQTVTTNMTEFCNLPGYGATISLSSTQNGYTYYLYSDGSPVTGTGGIVFGTTGSAGSFGTLATGSLMTVKSPSCSSMVNMSNAINLSPATPLAASVTIGASPGITVPAATSVTFTATPVNGGISPIFQWYVNATPDLVNGSTSTYTFTPLNGDQFYCEIHSSETCVTPATATSNTITMTVFTTAPPTAYNITGAGSYCFGTNGRQVGLSGSQLGVNYTLFKDGVPQLPVVAGSGSGLIPATWAGMTAGTYTASGAASGSVPAIVGTTQMLPLAGIGITENPFPGTAGTITGPATVNRGQAGVIFSVASIDNATGYTWWLPAGASITSGDNTNSITVSFSASAVSGTITVAGTNTCGNGTVSADFSLTVFPVVLVNLAVNGDVTGTKCYNAGEIITVAETAAFTVQATGHVELIAGVAIHYKPGTKVVPGGFMRGHIAPGGPWCLPAATLPAGAVAAGDDELPMVSQKSSFMLYPNPTSGKFTLEVTGETPNGIIQVAIIGMHGEKVLSRELSGERKYEFPIGELPAGLYFVKVIAGKDAETLKLIRTN